MRANPVQAGSQAEFSQWLCHRTMLLTEGSIHVSLVFPCERVVCKIREDGGEQMPQVCIYGKESFNTFFFA
ncbi:FAD-linked sulfhydryl oxidase ERV1 [Camellia lanceoleosa]|uniref:FAD-linked sulfhydryl oxidase ERV1 n=1 Tax=Camellia lanceoleosa TaxID=1840588 RepID=A0ACC0HA68_9ERIC|nr:FAD-linked sulfhydryl oxidase ERV1 [Camellia lanceoleosa]